MSLADHSSEIVNGNELRLSRLLDAPRERVWKAWTDPAQLTHWWGPNGFSTTTHRMEVKPGGLWRFVKHGPDGTDHPNRVDYLEVVEPERLVYQHGGESDVEPVHFHVTVTFVPEGCKTRLTMSMVFETPEELHRVDREYAAIEGANQTLARLGEHLLRLAA